MIFRIFGKIFIKIGNIFERRNRLSLVGDRSIEWAWAAAYSSILPGDKVLDFGCGDMPVGLAAATTGKSVTLFDRQNITFPFIYQNTNFLHADIMQYDLGEEIYHIIINCSSIEHVGISGRYGTRYDIGDADIKAMAFLKRALTSDGSMILTLPVGKDDVFPPYHRVYGLDRLPRLLEGFVVEREQYWTKNDNDNRYRLCSKSDALTTKASKEFYALGCFVLRKLPNKQE